MTPSNYLEVYHESHYHPRLLKGKSHKEISSGEQTRLDDLFIKVVKCFERMTIWTGRSEGTIFKRDNYLIRWN